MLPMKLYYLFLITLVLTGCRSVAPTTPNAYGGNLIWADEFDQDGSPNRRNWSYEEGFVRNYEKQYYTRSRRSNAYVKDGSLFIVARKEHYRKADYTSASLITLGKVHFEGDFRIEVSAKLPSGKGVWPAIWMLGADKPEVGFPKCGEMDIMEFVGHSPGKVHGTVHWWDSTATDAQGNLLSSGGEILVDDVHTTFHVYALERVGDRITIFYDGKPYFGFTPPPTALKGIFTKPYYLIFNIALGGTWGRDIDDTNLPQTMEIDYVRAYRIATR